MSAQNEKVKFTEKYAELWKFIKFSIAGFLSTAVELCVYYLLIYTVFKNSAGDKFVIIPQTLEWDAKGVFWAFVISTTIGYIIAFLLNRKTTFKADSNVVVSAILYTLMVIFTIFATALIGAWFMDLLSGMGHPEVGKTVGKPLAAALATVWTYPLNRFVIHRHRKPFTTVRRLKIGLSIFLSILTLGIYAIYWQYVLVKNTKILLKDETGCAKEMICLIFLPFYPLFWWFTKGETLKKTLLSMDVDALGGGWIYTLLGMFGLYIVSMSILQNDFNALPERAEAPDPAKDENAEVETNA